MDNLDISATETTPEIKFDFSNHHFLFGGESYPEHSDEFYRPILESIQQYSQNDSNEPATFVFKLTYFNSSSARVLMKLFELIDEMGETERSILNGTTTRKTTLWKNLEKIFQMILRMLTLS